LTLEELEQKLPNGFHDVKIFNLELDYAAGTAKLRLSLLVGWPDDPEVERQKYQDANLTLTGLCFCLIEPPTASYPFLPNGKPLLAIGGSTKPNELECLQSLTARLPEGTWCYRFFVDNWNACIYVAAKDAEFAWIGTRPKHAD
jgi:hypothetical protein